jgi:site-specific recombinase XerD
MAQKKIEEVSEEFWNNEVNEENKMFIEEFLQQQHLSHATLKQYESGLKIFAKWVHDFCIPKGEKKITQLKARDALKYQNWLSSKGLSPNAVKFKRSAVSTLCNYIELYYGEDYKDFRNIFTKAIPNVAKTNVKEKTPLTVEEIEMIAKELTKRKDWQKLVYLWFSYSTGCRREEARQVLAEVADYEIKTVTVKNKETKESMEKSFYVTHNIRAKGRGKEGKVRKFTFDVKTMEAIKRWMNYRMIQPKTDDCPYLFVSKTKEGYRQVSANTFNLWCDEFSNIIGGKAVHPHLFRSSRATHAKDAGVDIKDIQKLLGHESSQTTEIYIVQDDSEDLGNLF